MIGLTIIFYLSSVWILQGMDADQSSSFNTYDFYPYQFDDGDRVVEANLSKSYNTYDFNPYQFDDVNRTVEAKLSKPYNTYDFYPYQVHDDNRAVEPNQSKSYDSYDFYPYQVNDGNRAIESNQSKSYTTYDFYPYQFDNGNRAIESNQSKSYNTYDFYPYQFDDGNRAIESNQSKSYNTHDVYPYQFDNGNRTVEAKLNKSYNTYDFYPYVYDIDRGNKSSPPQMENSQHSDGIQTQMEQKQYSSVDGASSHSNHPSETKYTNGKENSDPKEVFGAIPVTNKINIQTVSDLYTAGKSRDDVKEQHDETDTGAIKKSFGEDNPVIDSWKKNDVRGEPDIDKEKDMHTPTDTKFDNVTAIELEDKSKTVKILRDDTSDTKATDDVTQKFDKTDLEMAFGQQENVGGTAEITDSQSKKENESNEVKHSNVLSLAETEKQNKGGIIRISGHLTRKIGGAKNEVVGGHVGDSSRTSGSLKIPMTDGLQRKFGETTGNTGDQNGLYIFSLNSQKTSGSKIYSSNI